MQRVVDALKNYELASYNFERLSNLSFEERIKVSNDEYFEILRSMYETKKKLRIVREEVLQEITVKYSPKLMQRTWKDKDGNEHILEYLQL